MSETICTQSGIPGVGYLAWGDHICHFYGTKEDLVDSLVPFFKAGLDNKEKCLWVASQPFCAQDARAALGSVVADLAEREARGQIRILEPQEWYLKNSAFTCDDVLRGWLQEEIGALNQGYTGMRVNGNTYWVSQGSQWETFLQYESCITQAFRGRRIIVMCSYCLSRCSGKDVLDIMRYHQFGVAKRDGSWEIMESAALRMARAELFRLNQVAEFREQFLGVVSHDLRNPLHAISLAAETLLHSDLGYDEDVRRKLYQRISRSARRMGDLIADLLDFTRARLGPNIPVDPQMADINIICRSACEELELIHPDRHIELEFRAHGCGFWDSKRLTQAISNLLANALQYSPNDTPVIVRTRQLKPDEAPAQEPGRGQVYDLAVEIHNWGDPISPDLLPRIFEPFRRGVHSHPSSGLGLGLYISERIVSAHEGYLSVRSSKSEGTTFTMMLPRRRHCPAQSETLAGVADEHYEVR